LRAAELAGLSATHIFYEAPHRLDEFLSDAAAVLGPRPAAVCRELTKHFEEVRRGTLTELAAHYASTQARGEICIVIGTAPPETATAEDLDAALRQALASMSVKDAAAHVATATGLPKAGLSTRSRTRAGVSPRPWHNRTWNMTACPESRHRYSLSCGQNCPRGRTT
jgi:16S rRNA (cytidine1402-2'-O)-methyltransferase